MNVKIIFLAVIAIGATAPAHAAANDQVAMAQAVSGFYTVHNSMDQDGIPDAKTRAKYEPYISPALDRLLADGDAAETRYAKANADSPSLVEGDAFSSNFEDITSFKIGACTGDATVAHCAVALTYDETKTSWHHAGKPEKPLNWTESVYLVMMPKGWRVDDIAFGGNWEFGNHGRLVDLLKQVIKDSND